MSIPNISQSTTSTTPIPPAEKTQSSHQFPKEIAMRLRTLNLLSQQIIGKTAPLFCKIIYYLDQPKSTISYKKCEELFEEAFIKEFSHEDIDLFLSFFLKKFDPEENFICYKNLGDEGKQFLWESLIKYYCKEYIAFETEADTLETILRQIEEKYDPEKTVILRPLDGQEEILEQCFDHSMNIIPQFTGDELIEMKLLLINYSALLISSLKKVEEEKNPNLILDNGFTLPDLFEEIYAILLDLPFLPHDSSNTLSPFHESLDGLQMDVLKDKFLSALCDYILDSQDPFYEKNRWIVIEVMSKCYFLDYELKDFLLNIHKAASALS